MSSRSWRDPARLPLRAPPPPRPLGLRGAQTPGRELRDGDRRCRGRGETGVTDAEPVTLRITRQPMDQTAPA